MSQQRLFKETISAEQRRQLDEQGFVWDERLEAWNEAFAALMTFKQREGHCRVPRAHSEGDFKLGRWVIHQRTRKETMPSEWRRRLEERGFVWNTSQYHWERGFDALLRFKQREGHCLVPNGHKEEKFNLGNWVMQQRVQNEAMLPERKRRLEEEGFSWGIRDERWEEAFAALMTFKQREGHCRVPQKHFEGDFNLGVQRHRNKRGKITDEQRRLLAEQGFLWAPHKEAWERGLAALVKFKQREGHCHVRQKRLEGDFNLGNWVAKQRRALKEGSLSTARIARLEAEGFEWEVAAAPRPNAPSSQAAS